MASRKIERGLVVMGVDGSAQSVAALSLAARCAAATGAAVRAVFAWHYPTAPHRGRRGTSRRGAGPGGLAFLGVALDLDRNAGAAADCDISAPGVAVTSLVIPVREDAEIARQCRDLMAEEET